MIKFRIRDFLFQFRIELAIVTLGALLRIFLHANLPILHARDSYAYLNLARTFSETLDFSLFLPHRTPGFPTFLAATFWLFGESGFVICTINAIASFISGMLLYLISRNTIGVTPARIVLFLVLTQPTLLIFENVLLTEVITRFFVISSLFFTYRWIWRNQNISHAIAAGVLGSCAILTRPDSSIIIFGIGMLPCLFLSVIKWPRLLTGISLWIVGMIPLWLWIIFVGLNTGIWNITAASQSARLEGLVYTGLTEGLCKQRTIPCPGDLNFIDAKEHYRTYDKVRSKLAIEHGLTLEDPRVFKYVEQYYQRLAATAINHASPGKYLSALIYTGLVSLGLGNPEQSDLKIYFSLLSDKPIRFRKELCDLYGSVTDVSKLPHRCIAGIANDTRSGASHEVTAQILFRAQYYLNYLIFIFLCGSTILALKIICFRKKVPPISLFVLGLIASLVLNSLAHAYYLAMSHRYYEVFSSLAIFVGVCSWHLFKIEKGGEVELVTPSPNK